MQANTPESGRIAATQRTEGSGPLLLMVPWQNERAKLQWRRLQALTCPPQRFHTTKTRLRHGYSSELRHEIELFAETLRQALRWPIEHFSAPYRHGWSSADTTAPLSLCRPRIAAIENVCDPSFREQRTQLRLRRF